MNIVRLVDHFPSPRKISYGLEPTFYHLSREQARLGLNVHAICRGYPHQKRFEEMQGIHIHRVMSPYNLFMLYELLKVSRHTRVDLIHTHATSGLSYAVLKKFLHARLARIGYIAHVHGTTRGILSAWSKIRPEIFEEETVRQRVRRHVSIMRETVVWKSADILIANSKFLRDELVALYEIPKEKIHVVYNGVDLRTFYPRKSRKALLKALGLDFRSRIILYLGGFRPVKGPLYIMKALKEIYDKFKEVKVLFVGGKHPLDISYEKAVMKLVRKLREKGAIRVIENIPHAQLPKYYSAADAVVLPSIYDSFPKVMLEAMACGTPVIASSVGGIPEIISHGETGILVEPANSDELAKAIVTIVLDPDLRKKVGFKARRLVEERFTWEHTAKRTLAIYRKLLSL